jgi:hypothetical protein
MSIYAKAWLASLSTFVLLFAMTALWGTLERRIGGAAGPICMLGFFAGSVFLYWRVRCPVCGTSPFDFGRSLSWTSPFPQRRCAKCGEDLRRRSLPSGKQGRGMAFEVRSGDEVFGDLGPEAALAKAREIIASGADPYIYDQFGDPMGLVELERAVQDAGFDKGGR